MYMQDGFSAFATSSPNYAQCDRVIVLRFQSLTSNFVNLFLDVFVSADLNRSISAVRRAVLSYNSRKICCFDHGFERIRKLAFMFRNTSAADALNTLAQKGLPFHHIGGIETLPKVQLTRCILSLFIDFVTRSTGELRVYNSQ